jgi:hypothetical protein
VFLSALLTFGLFDIRICTTGRPGNASIDAAAVAVSEKLRAVRSTSDEKTLRLAMSLKEHLPWTEASKSADSCLVQDAVKVVQSLHKAGVPLPPAAAGAMRATHCV